MKKMTIEFPVVGYAELVIEVEDDLTSEDVLEMIRDGDIEPRYNGHAHSETLIPLFDMYEAKNLDIPQEIAVVN